MRLRTEQPHVRAICKDGGFYGFPMEQLTALKTHWMGRETFYEAVDLWGDIVTLKLGDIVNITVRTQAGCDAIDEEEEERKSRSMVDG